jgi:hypothetical protein
LTTLHKRVHAATAQRSTYGTVDRSTAVRRTILASCLLTNCDRLSARIRA